MWVSSTLGNSLFFRIHAEFLFQEYSEKHGNHKKSRVLYMKMKIQYAAKLAGPHNPMR